MNTRCFRSATLAVVAVVTATVCAPAQMDTDDAQIVKVENGLMAPVVIAGQKPQQMTLRSRMEHYHVPAVSIAFFDASGILWARAYGATTEPLFQAGSISKAVSAVAIMRLVQDGRLKLDENVNNELIGWKLPENARWWGSAKGIGFHPAFVADVDAQLATGFVPPFIHEEPAPAAPPSAPEPT